MIGEIIDILLSSVNNAFIDVTVFVGAVLMIFGYINYKQAGKLVESIGKSKKAQPFIGALLGLTPGCGGAIFVMPLFPAGVVSFGTVVATLIATMGDSAFVLMSVMPKEYIYVSILSFIVAIIVGYILDYFNIGQNLYEDIKSRTKDKSRLKSVHSELDHPFEDTLEHIGHEEGDEIDMILHHDIKGHQDVDSFGYKFTHSLYPVYWVIIAIGLVLAIMDLFQIDIDNLFIPNLGTVFSIVGVGMSVLMMIMSKKFIQDDTHEEAELKALDIKETIIHNAQETSFIATWVFVAYLVYEIFVLVLGGGSYAEGEALMTSFLSQTGLIAVLVGALIGIIPGCGPQIIFVTLYTRGMVPFAALLANAISQDGDALFPLIAIDKKSALWSTVYNTIAAIVFGIPAYLIEMKFFIP